MEWTAARTPYTWPIVAVVNDASSGVSDADGRALMQAVERQVLEDFGPIWHIGAHFEYVPIGEKPPAGVWTVALLSSSDEAGALGYHDLTPDGLPLGKVFAGTDRQYGQNIGVTLSHEVLEMLVDPWISLAAQDSSGKFYAWECGDPVEADALGYQKGPINMALSAFVTPAWFGAGSGPVSYPQGRVSKPFELAPGGYISVFDPNSGQGWQQVTSRVAPAEALGTASVPALDLIRAVPRVGSRRERRFRGRDLWVASTYKQR